MKKKTKQIELNSESRFNLVTLGFFILVMGIAGYFLLIGHAASTQATLYLSPSSGSIVKGSAQTINVYEDSGSDQVNSVQANLSYPSGSLSCTNASITSSPAFPVAAESTCGSGSVHIGRGAFTAVTGIQLVASVQFTATAGSGTASISFAGGSAVVRSSDAGSETLTTTGGSYTLSAPAPPPPPSPNPSPTPAPTPPPSPHPAPPPPSGSPSPSPNPSPSSSGSPSPSPSPSPATSSGGLSISAISVTDIGYSAATINWSTTKPANSAVSYGSGSGNYQLGASATDLVTAHTLVLPSNSLEPGITYHFMVTSVDADGNTATSSDTSFTTKGINLIVTVVNQKGEPIKGAKVTIDGKTEVTDAKGQATIPVSAGKHTAAIVYQGKTLAAEVEAAAPASGGLNQTATVKIKTSRSPLIIILPVVIMVLAAIIAGWVMSMRRKSRLQELERHFPKLPGGSESSGQPPVIPPTITPSGGNPPTA